MRRYFQKTKIYQTRGIANEAEVDNKFKEEIKKALQRFLANDWGIISEEDKRANIEAVQCFNRVLGAYMTSQGRIWVLGESNNGVYYDVVTVLFHGEY